MSKSNFNVSEQLTLILKNSGLLKQSFDIIRWSKEQCFVWHPTDTGISPVTASNSV